MTQFYLYCIVNIFETKPFSNLKDKLRTITVMTQYTLSRGFIIQQLIGLFENQGRINTA